jgi:dolichol-phosphate mannosyltransferase
MHIKQENIDLSIVIPLLNEEGNISVLYDSLVSVLSGMSKSYEIIFVDDGSKDASFSVISAITAKDKKVLGISLSRNFGHQIALTAGMEHSSGDVVITMDGDMQHPPSVIPLLFAKYQEGFDIVNTIRSETADSGAFKKASSSGFYKIMNSLSEVHIEPASADFRLMSRKTVEAFLRLKEKDRFTRGLISWMGFRQAMIPYVAPKRYSGKTKYSFTRMLSFAADGITAFSAKPLRISFFAGLIVSFIGLLYSIFAIVKYFRGETIQGWTSIMVCILIIGGIQLISIGIIGEYLARVFHEAKNRPLYLVREYTAAEREIKH